VIFDPAVYPLNKSMFTGKMPKTLYEEEYPLEFQTDPDPKTRPSG